MQIWDSFPCDHYLSLVPWASLDLESDTPRPAPFFLAGVAPEVVASLHEAHHMTKLTPESEEPLGGTTCTIINRIFSLDCTQIR